MCSFYFICSMLPSPHSALTRATRWRYQTISNTENYVSVRVGLILVLQTQYMKSQTEINITCQINNIARLYPKQTSTMKGNRCDKLVPMNGSTRMIFREEEKILSLIMEISIRFCPKHCTRKSWILTTGNSWHDCNGANPLNLTFFVALWNKYCSY